MQIVFKMNDVVNDKSLNLILDDADKKEIAESKAFRDGLKNVCDLFMNIESPCEKSKVVHKLAEIDFEHDHGKFGRVVFYMKNDGMGKITIDMKDSDSKTFIFNVEDRKISVNELKNIVEFINDTKEQYEMAMLRRDTLLGKVGSGSCK